MLEGEQRGAGPGTNANLSIHIDEMRLYRGL